jgi:hypothetical protein
MQSLGGVTFGWNPDRMDIPESKKTVASVLTYSSTAVFQWPEQIEGVEITLEWDWMSALQYRRLRARYLDPSIQVYNPDMDGETFGVIVLNLVGTYFETTLNEFAYREGVKLTLGIVSQLTYANITTTTE